MRTSSSYLVICTGLTVSTLAAVIAGCSSTHDDTNVMIPDTTTDGSAPDDAAPMSTDDASPATGSASDSVTAMIEASTFSPVTYISGNVTNGGNSYWNGTTTSFLFTDAANACADLAKNTVRATSTDVFFQLSSGLHADDAGGFTGAAVAAPGVYPVTPSPAAGGNGAQGELDQLDTMCSTAGANGKDIFASGTVTITAVSATVISGSLDVLTQTGIHVSGSFYSNTCASIGALGGDSQTCGM